MQIRHTVKEWIFPVTHVSDIQVNNSIWDSHPDMSFALFQTWTDIQFRCLIQLDIALKYFSSHLIVLNNFDGLQFDSIE